MNLKKNVLFALMSLLYAVGFAQQGNTLVGTDRKTVKLFFEKTYLQIDRSYYNVGEDIWFSAYLVNGKSTSLTSTSNNLYVELISPDTVILDRKNIRIDDGRGKGDFKLKDALPSGWYTIRAYTNWMRNFKNDFVFEKRIYIANAQSNLAALPENKDRQSKKYISFFPEGGSLVEGLSGIVAFKTSDGNGNGIQVMGNVISSKGDTVTSFQSTAVGTGIFAFMPNAGEQYHVEGFYGKEKFSSGLPLALKKGLVLHLSNDSASIKISIAANEFMFKSMQGKPITVLIKHAGDNVYTGTFNLSKSNISLNISTKDLPRGIAVLTIIDDMGRPHCERLLYIQGNDYLNFTVSTDKVSYKPREKVVLHIKVRNILGQPLPASLSLAAVDAMVPDDNNNILSYLLLQSEIRGEIKNAEQYFDPKNPSRLKQLDLLLMTQGWRDYLWRRLGDTALKVSFLPEPGITLRGLVRERMADKPMPDMNITLFGSNFTGNKIFMTKTDQTGHYYLDGLNWYGNEAIKLSSQDARGKKGGWLQIDTLFKPLAIQRNTAIPFEIPGALNSEMGKRITYNRSYKFGDSILLDEVNVLSNKNNKVVLFDQTLTTFGYADQVFNITAADYSYKGLEHYLLTNVKGAQSIDDLDSTGSEGVAFISNGKKVRPRMLINRKEDLSERLDYYSLTMDQINQVVVKHLVGNTGQDVYVISLNLKDSALRGPNLNLLNINLNGYYAARSFYAPVYGTSPVMNKDLRTTVFWAPLLKTDEKGELSLSYFNGDNKSRVIIRIAGISDKGVVIAANSAYKVQ